MNLPVELQADEHVVHFTRRHWYFLLRGTLVPVLLAVVPAALLLWLAGSVERVERIGAIAAAVWLLALGVGVYFAWYRYWNDIWVITNQRLIDSYKRHWFHHDLASADLVNVEDVSLSRSGLFGTMLNFGDLRVQTAAEQLNFTLGGIPRPAATLAILDRTRDAARRDALRP